MKNNYNKFLDNTLRYEGGYVNDPRDPGGPTNMGITQATLSAYRGRPVSANDVKNITRAEVAEIYRKRYWDAVKGDDLPSGVDLYVADFAVHSGVDRSSRFLQGVLGVSIDGKVGPITLEAAHKADAKQVIQKLHDRRMSFMKGLSTWKTYGRGWASRTEQALEAALSVAGKTTSSGSSASGLLQLLVVLFRTIFRV